MIDVDALAEILCLALHDKPRPRLLFGHRVPGRRMACPLHIGVAVKVAAELEATVPA